MAVQSGKDLLVKIDINGSLQFETIAGLRASRISFNAETVDVTSLESAGGWRELLAGGGRPVTVVMNITTPDVQGFQRSQSQIAAQAARALSRGQRNR